MIYTQENDEYQIRYSRRPIINRTIEYRKYNHVCVWITSNYDFHLSNFCVPDFHFYKRIVLIE